MTILVSLLVGAALIVTIGALGGRPAIIALATLFAILVVVGVAADARRGAAAVRQAIRDRTTGQRRLRDMRENDALNRILDGKLRRG